jgi:hypothetical protein
MNRPLYRKMKAMEDEYLNAGINGLALYAENEYLRQRVSYLSKGTEGDDWRTVISSEKYNSVVRECGKLQDKLRRLEDYHNGFLRDWREALGKFPTFGKPPAPADEVVTNKVFKIYDEPVVKEAEGKPNG